MALAPALLGGPGRLLAAPDSIEMTGMSPGFVDIGTCIVLDQIKSDRKLRQTISDRYTCLTPEYSLQWSSFEPTPGNHQLAAVDGIVDFANAQGMKVFGHALLWEQGTPGWGTPGWVKKRLASKPDWTMIRRRFEMVLTRYRDDIPIWNVVNEPIETTHRSDGLRANVFLKAFGPGYIEQALETAREFAPQAELMINEYSLEYENPVDRARRTAVLRLIERLKSRGVPLDSFGVQGHLDLGKGPLNAKAVSQFLREVADFGLRIHVTELDVQERDYSLSVEKRDRKVADETARFLDIVLEQPAVASVTTWGVSDKYSWLKPLAKSQRKAGARLVNRGLPYDGDMRPKPMAVVLADALVDRTATSSFRSGSITE